MTYIMDMASGTGFPAEEPSYKVSRGTGDASCDATHPMGCPPQLQLATVELQPQHESRSLPAAAIEALIDALED